jgi:hypothetical protein
MMPSCQEKLKPMFPCLPVSVLILTAPATALALRNEKKVTNRVITSNGGFRPSQKAEIALLPSKPTLLADFASEPLCHVQRML